MYVRSRRSNAWTPPAGGALLMAGYVARKVARAVVVLLLVSLAVSSMLDMVPGDPAYAILGDSATPESIAQVHQRLGLDRPYFERFVDWVGSVARGDFGESYLSRTEVSTLIKRAVPITAELIVVTMIMGLLISVPLAIYAAKSAGKRFDRTINALSSLMQAMPAYVSVPLFVYVIVLKAGLLPATGWVGLTEDPVENLRHIILPCFVMSLSIIPIFTAALRSDMIATLQQDFILNARAKGLSERAVLFRHALRPSSFSLFTLIGLALGQLVSSAVVVEVLFVLPGIGSLSVQSINSRDLPIVQGVVMFIALWYVLINTFIDIGYRVLDPRVRMEVA
jgi:peptide/nickel transport system permease protein